MGEQKRKKQNELHRSSFIFKKKNYQVMLIGLGVIALGFILMSGGGSDDPNVFNPEIYNWRRIRLAPALVLIGFGIEVYAILLNPDSSSTITRDKVSETFPKDKHTK
ncbi:MULTISPECIES: DUF3098 domain-containing protein [unclassified Leeuwenhoekiella]|uniref:DUF3098 domain-containing protein n=1 Tax=unclassified Leeuwenhoekiella TaxID=2615029 RepID=UPI00068E66A0|nr:DUF3098 domain-containing protein [Leeuwenhoekiella sp. MAR_2009_132]